MKQGLALTPGLSIVVPLYNKEAEVLRCIHSVLAQTYTDFELLVIDDGSTDKSADLVETIRDSRLKLIHQQNQGLAATRNNGVRDAQAAFIVFLDADDEWLPDHLENIRALTQRHPEAGAFFTAFWIDRGEGWIRPIRLGRLHLNPGTSTLSDYFSIPDGRILPSATAVRKAAILAAGGYRTMFGEDIDLALRMAALYPVAYSPRATAIWHIDAANRMCEEQSTSKKLYVPGSLLIGLKQVSEIRPVSLSVEQRALAYVQRREETAMMNILISGDRSQARTLYRWWRHQFKAQSFWMTILLSMPSVCLKAIRTIKSYAGKLNSLRAYAFQRAFRNILSLQP